MAMKLYSDISVQAIADSIRDLENKLNNVGYTRIEYIASNGSQYIDMGFKANQDTKILLDYQQTEVFTSAKWFFGSRYSSASRAYGFLVGSDQNYATPYNKGSGSNTFYVDGGTLANDTNRHVMIKQRLNDESTKMGTFDGKDILVYGTSSQNQTAYESFETPTNVTLFNGVQSSSHFAGAITKIFECKVWKDGTILTRDFVPVKRNTDNEVGMYDLVNNVFYANQGTGTFTGGEEYPKYKIDEMANAISKIANKISNSN